MLFGIKKLKLPKQGFNHINFVSATIALTEWPGKKIITGGKLLSVPCDGTV